MNDHRADVTIRPFVDDDLADFLLLAADPRVTRHVGDGRPWDVARATERAGAAGADGQDWFSIVVDGRAWAGIVILERTEDAAAELGIWIHPDHWGRGVATRAATAALARHVVVRPRTSVIAHVAPDNTGSRKLLSRLGFQQGSRVRSRYGTPVDRFVLPPNPDVGGAHGPSAG